MVRAAALVSGDGAKLQAILDSDPARRAEWEANFKLANDPRVTPLGRFLRRTRRLDDTVHL